MRPIHLIRDEAQLEGTCHFEFLPGRYEGQCWNAGSVFLAEEVFWYIEPIFERNEPEFDHYSFVTIQKPVWQRIIDDLERLARKAAVAKAPSDFEGEVGFFVKGSEAEFALDFDANARALVDLSRELASWLREQLQQHECISVLGM